MQSQATRGIQFREPPIFERGAPGRSGASLPALDVPPIDPSAVFGTYARKEAAALPEVSEPEAFRHFVRLSQWNYCIDSQFYPLGSCTMKFNPKINEWAARLPGFARLHPLAPDQFAQGALEITYRLERLLAEIAGMDGVSLQPAAGAQGELTGLMMIRAYHGSKGRSPRKVFIPDTAHGTNPASCALNGLSAVPSPSGADGVVDPAVLERVLETAGDDVAAIMITNPNTLGLYESAMPSLVKMIHDKGGLVYGDGANMNAVLGRARPGDVGVDVMQYNLHKTFTTPHGGGGPGSGPVAFKSHLAPFAPAPVIVEEKIGTGAQAQVRYRLDYDRPGSVGRLRAFNGQFGMIVRAYTYIRELGADGLKQVSDLAVLNANYLASLLRGHYPLAFDRTCMHEAVFTDADLEKQTGVKTLDVAKRLIDYGFHPPTVYFPLVVKGALMIEPTETESKDTLDRFCAVLRHVVAEEDPEVVKGAPHNTAVGRVDEVRAVKEARLTHDMRAGGGGP